MVKATVLGQKKTSAEVFIKIGKPDLVKDEIFNLVKYMLPICWISRRNLFLIKVIEKIFTKILGKK